MTCPERQRRRRSRRLRRRHPPLFWECFKKIVGHHLWTKMDADCMDWGPMHIVYKLIRKKKHSWITLYLSWYNETAFSELIWTLERQAWQMMMDPDVLRDFRRPRTPRGSGLPLPTAAPPAWCPPTPSEKS